MRAGAGCGPNGTVAGRVRAQLFQPAQFLSKFVHCLCLSVGGLPDSSLCVRACVCECVACVCGCVDFVLLARQHVCGDYLLCMRRCIHTCVRATRCRA